MSIRIATPLAVFAVLAGLLVHEPVDRVVPGDPIVEALTTGQDNEIVDVLQSNDDEPVIDATDELKPVAVKSTPDCNNVSGYSPYCNIVTSLPLGKGKFVKNGDYVRSGMKNTWKVPIRVFIDSDGRRDSKGTRIRPGRTASPSGKLVKGKHAHAFIRVVTRDTTYSAGVYSPRSGSSSFKDGKVSRTLTNPTGHSAYLTLTVGSRQKAEKVKKGGTVTLTLKRGKAVKMWTQWAYKDKYGRQRFLKVDHHRI